MQHVYFPAAKLNPSKLRPRLLLASDVHSIGKIGLAELGGTGLLLSCRRWAAGRASGKRSAAAVVLRLFFVLLRLVFMGGFFYASWVMA